LNPKALDHSLISPFSTDTIVVPEQQEQQQEQQREQQQEQQQGQQQDQQQEHQDSQEQHSKSESQDSESTVQSLNQSSAEQESKGKKAGPTITVNTQLGVASKKDTIDMEATSSTISSPPSSSSSNGSYSLTPNPSVPRPIMTAAPGLVSMGPAGVGSRTGIPPYERREMLDQEHDRDDMEACCSCAVPDWETFKAGVSIDFLG
jgi:transcription initiation factor TFIID subunit TAF12